MSIESPTTNQTRALDDRDLAALHDRAIAAHHQAIEAAKLARAENQARAHKVDRELLQRRIKRVLDIDVEVDRISFDESHNAFTLLGGWEMKNARSGGELLLTRDCPDCDGLLADVISAIEQYGRMLEDGAPGYHSHWFADDSTHPNAPKPSDRRIPPPPTTAESLEELFREIVREEISER